ncbi:hypothetical protein [Candidatus Leptofilum sp.]|uniref:hypothetical protein n=1 Tax=Candidatus Leptofilum sp. TaxID=3241576 RepID=UPI003B5BC8A7
MNLKKFFSRKKQNKLQKHQLSSSKHSIQAGTVQIGAIALVTDMWLTFDSDDTFNSWVQNVIQSKYPGLELPPRERINAEVGFKGEESKARAKLLKMLQQIVSETKLNHRAHYKEFFIAQSEIPPMKVWGSVLLLPEQTEISEDMSRFINILNLHLQRLRHHSPNVTNFLDDYLNDAAISEIAVTATDKMQLTQSDNQQHSSVLVRGDIVFHISTLPVDMRQAKDWFWKTAQGYTNLLENAWDSLLPKIDSSVWCHIIYGLSPNNRNWIHMAIFPVKKPAPFNEIFVPIEFLTLEEQQKLGLAITPKDKNLTESNKSLPGNVHLSNDTREKDLSTVQSSQETPTQGEKAMSSEGTITQYLQQLGAPATPFVNLPGTTGLRSTTATYMGLQVELQIHNEQMLMFQFMIGYAPSMNAEAILRHLMVLNSMMIGVYFCIFSANNAIVLRSSRMLTGLDFVEFKQSLDTICSAFMQNAVPAVQTFQISPQPLQ